MNKIFFRVRVGLGGITFGIEVTAKGAGSTTQGRDIMKQLYSEVLLLPVTKITQRD